MQTFTIVRRAAQLLTFILLAQACRGEESSTLKTFFGPHAITVIEESQVQSALEKSLGALYVTAKDENQKTIGTQKICTALQISPKHVLTNAHCMKKKDADNYADFYFSKDYIALDGEGSAYSVDDLFDEIYLKFTGKTRMDPRDAADITPNLKVSFVSIDLDYAVLEITDASFDANFTPLSAAVPVTAHTDVQLLSFPNAMPLTRSSNCAIDPLDAKQIKHDCGSSGGSSGGILFLPGSSIPVALHKQGVYFNSATFYRDHLRSETPVELAARECSEKYNLDPKAEKYQACIDHRSKNVLYNRAVPLTLIQADLATQVPDLFSSLEPAPEAAAL